MKLDPERLGSVPHSAGKTAAVLGGRDTAIPIARQTGIRMGEIEMGPVVDTREEGTAFGMRRVIDRVPADVGTLTPSPARRLTSPGSRASPATHGSTVPGAGAAACSLPRSKSSCMPRQMPKSGRRLQARSRRASACPDETIYSMASANAPTPGTTAPHAAAITDGSSVTRTSAPDERSPRSTDMRLPLW